MVLILIAYLEEYKCSKMLILEKQKLIGIMVSSASRIASAIISVVYLNILYKHYMLVLYFVFVKHKQIVVPNLKGTYIFLNN